MLHKCSEIHYEYLLWIQANVDVCRSIMRVAYTKTIFCLCQWQPKPIHNTIESSVDRRFDVGRPT